MLEIEKEKIIWLSKIVIDAEKKGIENANKEGDNIMKKIFVDPFDKNDLYGCLLNWKVNYQKDLKSDYHLINHLSSNNLSYVFLKGSVHERFAAAALFFYNYHDDGTAFKEDKFINKFEKQIEASIRLVTLFNFCNKIIYIVNNKDEGSLKLPLIEDFEVNVFKILEKDIVGLRNKLKINSESKDACLEMINNKSEELLIAFDKLNEIEIELRETKEVLSSNKNYTDGFKRYISLMENAQISQFDELYWGDNYPALKVLFNFFQKYKMIEIPWSLFANQMCIENIDFINLNSGIFGKNDMGYLLNSIKTFFKKEFRVKKETYNDWLISKVFINNKELDKKYAEKFVRNFSKTKYNLKNEIIINNLLEQIQSRCI